MHFILNEKPCFWNTYLKQLNSSIDTIFKKIFVLKLYVQTWTLFDR